MRQAYHGPIRKVKGIRKLRLNQDVKETSVKELDE